MKRTESFFFFFYKIGITLFNRLILLEFLVLSFEFEYTLSMHMVTIALY